LAEKTLGQVIKEFRAELNLPVEVVAEKAKLSVPFWYKLEAGTKNPSLKTLTDKIAPALNKKPTDFFIAI